AYATLGLSFVNSNYLVGVVAGIVWYLAGSLWSERTRGVSALGPAAGELFEYGLQLVVNTVSFIRVGAFALAHAGLGATVFSLATSSESVITTILVLFIGNIMIIALEGLVVSVQTTRLLLFEFFIRFMKAGGRPFRPLVPPDYAIAEAGKEAV
ncbi:MAG: ATPase, partial [Pseudomonadales bacterium]|nr:ATPase [Pseudomonadales bacterium]